MEFGQSIVRAKIIYMEPIYQQWRMGKKKVREKSDEMLNQQRWNRIWE